MQCGLRCVTACSSDCCQNISHTYVRVFWRVLLIGKVSVCVGCYCERVQVFGIDVRVFVKCECDGFVGRKACACDYDGRARWIVELVCRDRSGRAVDERRSAENVSSAVCSADNESLIRSGQFRDGLTVPICERGRGSVIKERG